MKSKFDAPKHKAIMQQVVTRIEREWLAQSRTDARKRRLRYIYIHSCSAMRKLLSATKYPNHLRYKL